MLHLLYTNLHKTKYKTKHTLPLCILIVHIIYNVLVTLQNNKQ